VKITEFCIRRPITTAMFFLGLGTLGILSGSKMAIDLFPQVTYPAINVSTSYTGAGPEEIEQLVTIPIEQAVSGINQVKSITSTSQEGSSRVTVNFNWGLNLDEVTNDIRSVIDRVKSRLPDDADIPTISKYDPSQSPVMTIGLTGRMTSSALRKLADDELSYQLQKVNGVARVDVRGGQSEEIQVHLQQDRLQALGIAGDQIATILKNENSMQAAGHLAVGVGDFLLRTQGQFQTLDEIRNTVIATRNGIPIYLRDVATIESGFATNTAYVRIDGQPGIQISIQKRSGFNTVAVADGLYKAVADLQRKHPQITLQVLNDDSIYIRRAVNSVAHEAVIGGLLAGIMLLFFFHNLRATLIAGLAMPVSILITLMLAYFAKMSLNTFSLGGLALGVGMLVDNAVVVLDNIFRHYHEDQTDIATAALTGTSEMGPAISASTLTHICVFFPLLYIAGRSGIIFKELSYMVIFSILCSLLVAVTLIPMLCAKFLKVRDINEESTLGVAGYLTKLQNGWEDAYTQALEWCLQHKILALGVCSAIFGASLALYPFIGTELVQSTDEGVISINMQLPMGTRLEDTDRDTKTLEKQVTKIIPELVHLETSVGGRSGNANQPNQAYLTVRLQRKDKRRRTTQQIVDQLQKKLSVAGAKLRVTAQSSMRMFYGGSQFPVAVDIRGKDSELTQQTAVMITDKFAQIPGLANANMSREEARPELSLKINRQRAADLGITAATIATAIQTNIDGKVATIYRVNGDETNVRVNLQESDRQTWQDLQRIMIPIGSSQAVQLANVVTIAQTNGPVSIGRKDRERNITVQASLAQGRDLAGAMKDVHREIDALSLPPGVTIVYSGDYQEQLDSAHDMMVALLLALLLVYMVMAAQFESFFDPFIIMLAIPFALGGVLIALLITDTNINTQVYLGLIMLGGIVINNTIVLISYIRILLNRGMKLKAAVLAGARSRLRPILISTGTTVLGLVPMALGIGEGSETQTPLARTVIGGLLFSTVLTLVLIPIIFMVLESLLIKLNSRKMKPAAVTAALLLLTLDMVIAIPAQAAPAAQLTVKDAINQALQNSEDGKTIRQSREIVASMQRETKGPEKTQLYSTVADTTPPGTSTSTRKAYAWKLTAGKSIPLAKVRGVQSLADLITASNHQTMLLNAELAEQQLIYQVVTAYQKEITTQRDVALADQNYERSKAFNDEVQARSKLGLTAVSDETGAAAQLATAETNLNRARQLYQLARMKLRQLLGLDPETELTLIPATSTNQTLDLTNLRQRADQNRPDLKLSKEALNRAETNLKLAGLAKKLGFNFNWNWEREHFVSNLVVSNYSGSNRPGEWALSADASLVPVRFIDYDSYNEVKYGTLSFTIKWTICDGKVQAEREKQARLLRDQTQEALTKTVKNAAYDLQDAYYSYLNQLDKAHSTQLQLKYNQTYYETVQAKLRLGLATVKEVLDAQVVLNQSETDFERAGSDLYLNQVNLLRATGVLKAEQF
jgi:HAE1 family hydrophobic/amphiphilic exporter-1